MQSYPYAVYLTDHLQTAFPSTLIHVDVDGMSGAHVRGQYTGRLNRACTKAKDAPYDWIIIMGGTNDLGWGGQPQEIYKALRGCNPLPSFPDTRALIIMNLMPMVIHRQHRVLRF